MPFGRRARCLQLREEVFPVGALAPLIVSARNDQYGHAAEIRKARVAEGAFWTKQDRARCRGRVPRQQGRSHDRATRKANEHRWSSMSSLDRFEQVRRFRGSLRQVRFVDRSVGMSSEEGESRFPRLSSPRKVSRIGRRHLACEVHQGAFVMGTPMQEDQRRQAAVQLPICRPETGKLAGIRRVTRQTRPSRRP